MAINTYLSIIILNVNGLNSPIKRHRVVEWMEKTKQNTKNKTHIYAAYERLTSEVRIHSD